MAATERQRLQTDDDGGAQNGQREQEMRDHERRVQVCVDGDRPERRLCGCPDEGADREPPRPPRQRARQPRADCKREREDDRHAGDHPVSELDVRVVALLRERLAGLAAGPVLATQAGARQPDDGAGGHDHPQRRDRECGEP
jgi:hypothetical protein